MKTAPSSLRLQRAALQGLRVLVSEMRHAARAIEQRTGLTNAQLFVLRLLDAAGGPLSVGQLATEALSSPAAVSTIVSRLGRKGLVARRTSAGDARRVELTLTPAARRILRRAPEPPTARLVEAIAALPPAKLRGLAAGIEALSTGLGLDIERAPLLFEDRRLTHLPRRRRGDGR